MNLDKTPGWKSLKIGDAYTFILEKPMVIDFEDGRGARPVEVGDLVGKWHSTAEPGRNYLVVRITPEHAPPGIIPDSIAYETVFESLQEFEVAK